MQMEALSQRDLRRLLDSGYELGLVARMNDLPREVARIAYELVLCEHSGWIVIDFGRGGMEGVHWPHDLSELFSQVPSDLTTVPLVSAAALAPSTTVIRLSDFVSRMELHKTAIYNDLYRSLGVEYQIVVPISFGAPSSDGVRTKRAESLTLARRNSDFSEQERTLLDEFGRHVRNATRRLRSIGKMVTVAGGEQFGLTLRQSESLVAIADGASVRKAAELLRVTPKTLENHLQAAYGRLGVSNRTAALARLRSAEPANFGLGEIPY